MRGLMCRLAALLALVVVPALAACAAQAGDPGAAVAQQEVPQGYARAVFAVDGMTCGGCAIATKMALRKLDGVVEASTAFDENTGEGSAWAIYDPNRIQPDRLMAAIRQLGYSPTPVEG